MLSIIFIRSENNSMSDKKLNSQLCGRVLHIQSQGIVSNIYRFMREETDRKDISTYN